MKISEIVHVGTMEEYTDEELASTSADILAGATSEFPLEDGTYRFVVSVTGHHALFHAKRLVGWVKLTETVLGEKKVLAVVSTYVIPERRSTKDVLLLLLAVRQYTKKPIMVDGVLFKAGLSLLNALVKRKRVEATIVNSKTHQQSQYTGHQPLDVDDVVVLEGQPFAWVDMSICDDIPHIMTRPLEENHEAVWVKEFTFIKSQPAPG